jgi:predicted aminopeptidase
MYVSRAKSCVGLLSVLLLGGCETIGYYTHVAGGQLKLLADRRPVDEVLEDLDDETPLKARLTMSQQVLEYAESELALEVGGRYRSYVDVERSAVVWNLFAAPELSLEAHTWCYPFVGCAPYRGYFTRERAEQYAGKLESSGLETYIGRVSAYSTLGWFDDPLLSTFMDLSEAEFVELLFHELAHSRVWIKGDATFNESYASFVGREGLRRWLESQGRDAEFDAHENGQQAWLRARRLLERAREGLTTIYESDIGDQEKRAEKERVFAAAGGCLEDYARETGNDGYRNLIERLNNAYLASLATYSDLVPAFAALFLEEAGDWARFHGRVESLGELDEAGRRRWSSEEQVTAERNDDGADQIQCEALSGHGFDGESTGAEHDDVGRGGHG